MSYHSLHPSPFGVAISPIMEALKPIQPLFSAIGSAIGTVFRWFGDLLSPIDATAERLATATSAGEMFGKVLGTALNVVTTPARLLLKILEALGSPLETIKSGFTALSNPLGAIKDIGKFIAGDWLFGSDSKEITKTPVVKAATAPSTAVVSNIKASTNVIPFQPPQSASQPIITKPQASTRNNVSINSTPQYTININGSGLDEEKLAKLIKRELANHEREQQVKLQASLFDYSG